MPQGHILQLKQILALGHDETTGTEAIKVGTEALKELLAIGQGEGTPKGNLRCLVPSEALLVFFLSGYMPPLRHRLHTLFTHTLKPYLPGIIVRKQIKTAGLDPMAVNACFLIIPGVRLVAL